jgi:hypothetical protein
VFLAQFLALAACGGPTVASVDVKPLVVSHSPGRVPLGARALDASGEHLVDVAVAAVAVADDTIARVGKDGSVTCEKTGTTTVQLLAGGLAADVELRCLLISKIVPGQTEFSLEAQGERGKPLSWQVLDLAGQPVEGVPMTLAVADPSVARIEGTNAYGVTPGRTTLTWTAGDISAQVAVRVGRAELVHEALAIPEGGLDLAMKAGEWTVTVSARDQVTVSVYEGRCSETPAGRLHHLVCRPDAPTKLHIEPTGLLRDPTNAHVRGVYYPPS